MVLDVSEWEIEEKNAGAHHGYWVRHPKTRRRALVKLPRVHERAGAQFVRAETWAEAFAALVGKFLDLPVPDVEVAMFRNQLAALSWDFRPAGFSLREGADLSNTLPGETNISLDEVVQHLSTYMGVGGATEYVVRMACFDILIGNKDRHQRNWGVLVPSLPEQTPKLAPYYDNGAGFGSILAPETIHKHLLNGGVTFDRGFRYEITIAGKKPGLSQLLSALRGLDQSLARFAELTEILTSESIDKLMDQFQPEVVEPARREFAKELLIRRRQLFLRRDS